MKKLKICLDDEKTRRVWETALRAQAEYEGWPAWKKGHEDRKEKDMKTTGHNFYSSKIDLLNKVVANLNSCIDTANYLVKVEWTDGDPDYTEYVSLSKSLRQIRNQVEDEISAVEPLAEMCQE